MPTDLGAWLREQRETRGWSRADMARRLITAAKSAGDQSMPGADSMGHNIYRWERGLSDLSERHKFNYCRVFGIKPAQFGPQMPERPEPGRRPDAPAQPPPAGVCRPIPRHEDGSRHQDGRFTIQREVLMAAHEGSDHAARAEDHGIGEATLEQLRADVVRLSHQSDTDEPFPLFTDMRRVRAKIYQLLDRRLWPGEQSDLYFLLGCLNGLMGLTANRLGYPDAAEELIRSGWAYATAIDHRPLLATMREELAHVASWRGMIRESRDLAADGLRYLTAGPIAADLHIRYAQASARLGDMDAARRAITAANEAREREHHDDLLEIGGEYAISQATHHYFAGAALTEVAGAERQAAEEISRAVRLYEAGPGPGEQHWFGARALASIELAAIRLRSGALDGAAAALEPTLVLPPARRISLLMPRLGMVRAELAAPVFRGSAQARQLDERIEAFGRGGVAADLHSLAR
jgi:transcriptional regulator with XRE-family HTH domain